MSKIDWDRKSQFIHNFQYFLQAKTIDVSKNNQNIFIINGEKVFNFKETSISNCFSSVVNADNYYSYIVEEIEFLPIRLDFSGIEKGSVQYKINVGDKIETFLRLDMIRNGIFSSFNSYETILTKQKQEQQNRELSLSYKYEKFFNEIGFENIIKPDIYIVGNIIKVAIPYANHAIFSRIIERLIEAPNKSKFQEVMKNKIITLLDNNTKTRDDTNLEKCIFNVYHGLNPEFVNYYFYTKNSTEDKLFTKYYPESYMEEVIECSEICVKDNHSFLLKDMSKTVKQFNSFDYYSEMSNIDKDNSFYHSEFEKITNKKFKNGCEATIYTDSNVYSIIFKDDDDEFEIKKLDIDFIM